MTRKYLSVLLLPALLALGSCGSDNDNNKAQTTAPAAPGAPTLTVGGGAEISLSWTAVSGATSYEIHRDTDDNSAGATKLTGNAGTAVRHTDTGLMPETAYYYWLKACNSRGCSAFGARATATTTANRQYTVTLFNLTAGQVLAPQVAILHGPGYSAFTDGEKASASLEVLAEGGNPAPLLAAAMEHDDFQAGKTSTLGMAGALLPAPGVKAEFTGLESGSSVTHLTVLTMLARTNDGFTALNAELVSDLDVNETRVYHAPAWDAGTENNLETNATMPDQTGMVGGFAAARDDSSGDFISLHAGVISNSDGLSTSDLTHLERFDNPVMRVEVTRTQ